MCLERGKGFRDRSPLAWIILALAAISNMKTIMSARTAGEGLEDLHEGHFEVQNGASEGSPGPVAASVSFCPAWSGRISPGRRTDE